MSRIIDVSVNFRPHTKLKLYRKYGIAEDAGQALDPAAYIAEMDAAGVSMAGLISNTVANGVGGELLQVHVDEVYPVLEAHPDRFFGWAGINPLGGMETIRYIDRAITKLGFKGVHIYPHWFGVPINDRLYYPIYSKCCELGVPVTIQVGKQSGRSGAKLVGRPSLLEDIAFDFPELNLIGLHMGVPFEVELISCVLTHENVTIIADAYPPHTWSKAFVDFCAQRDWGNVDGSDRIMWGTDYPVQTMQASIDEFRQLDLQEDVQAKILGENAIRILNLDVK